MLAGCDHDGTGVWVDGIFWDSGLYPLQGVSSRNGRNSTLSFTGLSHIHYTFLASAIMDSYNKIATKREIDIAPTGVLSA